MRHGAADGQLIGDLGGLFKVFVEHHAIELGGDGTQFAAVLDRGIRLGVEGILVGHPTRKKDMDDRLGFGLWARWGLIGRVGLQTEEVVEGQPQGADQADMEKGTAGGALEVSRVIIPGSSSLRRHVRVSPVNWPYAEEWQTIPINRIEGKAVSNGDVVGRLLGSGRGKIDGHSRRDTIFVFLNDRVKQVRHSVKIPRRQVVFRGHRASAGVRRRTRFDRWVPAAEEHSGPASETTAFPGGFVPRPPAR